MGGGGVRWWRRGEVRPQPLVTVLVSLSHSCCRGTDPLAQQTPRIHSGQIFG